MFFLLWGDTLFVTRPLKINKKDELNGKDTIVLNDSYVVCVQPKQDPYEYVCILEMKKSGKHGI